MTLWGGRFRGKLDPAAWKLNASLGVDQRLAAQDVRGSLAWVITLEKAGVLSPKEGAQIRQGLQVIRKELEEGVFIFQESDEDIHTAVERRLGELTGPLGGKLHTGRSRNDQVATDFRLWLLDHLPVLESHFIELQNALLGRAMADAGIPMPGYTHLQRAQPVLLSHWWLSHFWPLQRDRERLFDLSRRTASLPLGSGALAGVPFPIDRAALAGELGFSAPAPNSIDAVSDRDFAAEFLFAAALTGVHLSRLAEAVILFSTAEFGYLELSEAYATGSSLMPQKKNPDVFELARGKAGGLIGLLAGLLATLKGLPSAYDKDLQEDKPPVFQAFDTLEALLPVLAGAISSLSVRVERLQANLDAGMMATDLADYLVKKGIPFRQAHSLAGQAVQAAIGSGVTLDRLGLEALRGLSPVFEADVSAVFDAGQSIARRNSLGGTAPGAVEAQMAQAQEALVPYFNKETRKRGDQEYG
jgi:argininosuccinate lyase